MVKICDPLEERAKGTDLWSLSYERRNPQPCFPIWPGAPCLTQAEESGCCSITLIVQGQGQGAHSPEFTPSHERGCGFLRTLGSSCRLGGWVTPEPLPL